jgi:asparagine synthase (glutamine-hydrolysing)
VCAIAGVFRFTGNAADDRAAVGAMLDRMRRRGPDDGGLWHEGPLTLGHRRLAVLDLSAAGHQPMVSACGRFVISFNGEIYNFAELRDELGLRPGDLRSATDTEVLLHAWQRWGVESLDRMVGQWAFALFDRTDRRLWLARDRFGEKPLFFARGPQALAFASSLQGLVQTPWLSPRIDRSALVEYLTLRYVVAPRTIVAGCEKLAPGHYLTVTPQRTELRRWYEPRFRRSERGAGAAGRAALAEEFGGLLTQAARRCLVSDVPTGLLLSDGIDSHAIHAAVALAGQDVTTFTYAAVRDGSGTRRSPSARSSRAPSWDVLVTPQRRLAVMQRALSSLSEPLGDGAALATWLLIGGAREKATVFLCGHGGDEIVGGYRLSQDRFRLAALHRCAWLPRALLRPLIESKVFGGEDAAIRLNALRSATAPCVPAAARYLIQHPLEIADVRGLLGPAQLSEGYLATVDRLYDECADDASDLDRIQEVMMRTFLGDNILSFADSMAMDWSAELRMPFLDRDLVAFVLGLAPSERVSPWPGRTNTKRVLRWWAEPRIPRDVARRRKRGFPYGNARELLDRDRGAVREQLRASPILRAATPGLSAWLDQPAEFFRGPREKAVWSLLALGHWCEASSIRDCA